MYLAMVGCFLSLVAHLCGYIGIGRPFGMDPWPLHIGVIVVCIPAVFAAQKLSKGYLQDEMWHAVLRGCPEWMKSLFVVIFAYAFISFFMFILVTDNAANVVNEANKLRGFSGHWLVFYYVSYAILYSYHKVMLNDSG